MIHAAILRQAKRITLLTPIPAIVAAITFLATLSHHAYPGYSTTLIAAATGLIPPSKAAHPLFSMVARSVAAINSSSPILGLNLFSVLCGTICAVLLYHLTAKAIFFLACEDAKGVEQLYLAWYSTSDEYALSEAVMANNRKIRLFAIVGGMITAAVLIFTLGAWRASTRADEGIFHLLLALASLCTFPTHNNNTQVWRLLPSVFFFSLGLFDSAAFLLLLPFYLYFLLRYLLLSSRQAFAFFLIVSGGAAALLLSIYAFRQNTPEPASLSLLATLSTYARGLLTHHTRQLLSFFPRSGWAHLILQIAAPSIVIAFGAQTLFKEEKISTAIILCLLTILATPALLALKIAPALIHENHLPCFGYAIIAVAVGFVAAACLIGLNKERTPKSAVTQEGSESNNEPGINFKRPASHERLLCGALLSVLVVLLLLMPWRNYSLLNQHGGVFADQLAQEILTQMGERTILISNGLLDNHLLIQARINRRPITLIPLNPNPDMTERKILSRLIESSPVFQDFNRLRLQNALSIGTVRFVMEWLNVDKQINHKAMVFSTPIIWTACGYRTVPEGIAFSGFDTTTPPDINKLIEQNRSFAQRVQALFSKEKESSGYLKYLHSELVEKAGFAANELGVYLEDQKLYEEAYQSYARAITIDPENVSAAVNQFALVYNFKIHTEELEYFKMRASLSLTDYYKYNTRNTMALLQKFGNINQQEFYLEQAKVWAERGALNVSQAKIHKAFPLAEQRGHDTLLQNAQIHIHAGEYAQAEECYLAALEQNSANTDALMGLCTLMIKQNKISQAENWFHQAELAGLEATALRYERIMLALLKKESDLAVQLLEAATKEEPADLRYWTMRADLMLERGDTQAVEFRILPEMQKILNNREHFLVHAVRGYLLRKKGPRSYLEARRSLLTALSLNASLSDLWQTVFELDLAINNPAFTESDARNLLNLDPEHALANYLLGASLLNRGALLPSEDFLRRSLENQPTAQAYNDLAENLRQQKKLVDAEESARKALQMEPELAPAHDTLACVLCDAGRFEEASQLAAQAVAAEPKQIIYQLTLLRAQVKLADKQGVLKSLERIPQHEKNIPADLRQEIQAL